MEGWWGKKKKNNQQEKAFLLLVAFRQSCPEGRTHRPKLPADNAKPSLWPAQPWHRESTHLS